MRCPLILLPLSTLAAGISLPELPPPSPRHPLSRRFIPEPRSTHLNWNVKRHELQDTGEFLARRSNLHSVEYFTNPPALRRRLALNLTLDDDLSLSSEDALTSKEKRAYPGRWQNMQGSCYPKYHPAPVSWGKGRQDLYYCAKDRTCQWRYKDKYGYPQYKDWYPKWEDLGGELDSPPHSCSRKKDNMHLFCKGTDGQAWHRSYEHDSTAGKGSWGNWQAMGGNMKGWPSSCSWGEKHASVYVSSNDGQCWYRRYDDDRKGWYSWENLGGYMAGPPKSVTWGYGHTSVYCRGQDGQAWHRQYDEKKSNKWGDWEPLGGSLDSEVAACAWEGRMDMFVKGSDGKCWWKTYKNWDNKDPKWGSWESLGGDMKNGVAPEVVAVGGKMELYITGKDDQLYRKTWDAGTDGWSDSWENMGGKVDTQPVAVKWDDGDGMVDVYGQGTDGTVKRCYTWD